MAGLPARNRASLSNATTLAQMGVDRDVPPPGYGVPAAASEDVVSIEQRRRAG